MYHPPNVGSVEPFAIGQLVIGCRLLNGLERRLQIGTVGEGDLVEIVERLQRVREIEGAGNVELFDRRAIVQQLQELNLGGAQVDDRRLQLRLVLHAQQLDAIEINLRDVARFQTVAADGDDLVVVVKVALGQIKNRLCFERLHKCRAQSELQGALQVLVLRLGDARSLLRALLTQFAFVVALMQVTDTGRHECALERLPDAVIGSDLGSIGAQANLWIWAQISRNLFGAHLVDVIGVSLKRRIASFELCLHLIPGERLLRLRRAARNADAGGGK